MTCVCVIVYFTLVNKQVVNIRWWKENLYYSEWPGNENWHYVMRACLQLDLRSTTKYVIPGRVLAGHGFYIHNYCVVGVKVPEGKVMWSFAFARNVNYRIQCVPGMHSIHGHIETLAKTRNNKNISTTQKSTWSLELGYPAQHWREKPVNSRTYD